MTIKVGKAVGSMLCPRCAGMGTVLSSDTPDVPMMVKICDKCNGHGSLVMVAKPKAKKTAVVPK